MLKTLSVTFLLLATPAMAQQSADEARQALRDLQMQQFQQQQQMQQQQFQQQQQQLMIQQMQQPRTCVRNCFAGQCSIACN